MIFFNSFTFLEKLISVFSDTIEAFSTFILRASHFLLPVTDAFLCGLL